MVDSGQGVAASVPVEVTAVGDNVDRFLNPSPEPTRLSVKDLDLVILDMESLACWATGEESL